MPISKVITNVPYRTFPILTFSNEAEKVSDFSGWTSMPHQEGELRRGPMKALEIT